MKRFLTVAITLVIASNLLASDKSEDGVPTSPLKIYSGGIAVGGMRAVNKEMKNDLNKNFLSLSFSSVFMIRDNTELFMDISAYIPNESYGADIGADFIFSRSEFRPFAGLGVGGFYANHGGDFGDDFGPTLTAHVGFTLDITENLSARLRAPFHFILNEYDDQTAGLDITFLFSSRLKKVKKLHYN